MLTFRQIEAFRYLYLTGKTTKAAEMLGISQPAVSRLLADLEKEIDLTLFERHGRRLKVTSEAKALYEEVQRAYVGLDRIQEAAANIKEYPQGKFCLVAIPSIEKSIAFDLVERFIRAHPNASIALETQPTNQAIKWVSSQQANVALAHPHAKPPGLDHAVVHSAPSVALVPAGHRLASREVLRPEDFEDEPFVSFRPDSLFRTELDNLFRDHGVRRDMKIECRTTEAVCRMVSQGVGVSVVGPYLPAEEHSGFCIRPFEPEVPVELALIWPTAMQRGVLECGMIRIIEEYFDTTTGILPSAS